MRPDLAIVQAAEDTDTLRAFQVVADLTVQAREAILNEKANNAKAKQNKKSAGVARLESGRYLLDLKTMIEAEPSLADGKSFWQWFDYHFAKDKICSRKDAEKRIALARSADPEGAAAEERRRTREAVVKHRANNAPAYGDGVSGNEPQQDQQHTGGEATTSTQAQPQTANHKAQSSDNVVSLRVETALKVIREMTELERDQLYSQLRKDDLL